MSRFEHYSSNATISYETWVNLSLFISIKKRPGGGGTNGYVSPNSLPLIYSIEYALPPGITQHMSANWYENLAAPEVVIEKSMSCSKCHAFQCWMDSLLFIYKCAKHMYIWTLYFIIIFTSWIRQLAHYDPDSWSEGSMSQENDPNKHPMSSEAEKWLPLHWASSAQCLYHGQSELSPIEKAQSKVRLTLKAPY